jgi:hypothetical protein
MVYGSERPLGLQYLETAGCLDAELLNLELHKP